MIAKRAKLTNKINVNGIWTNLDQNRVYYFKHNVSKSSKKIAGFDFDFTLTKPRKGKKFPTDGSDYELWHPKVKSKLEQVHADGFRIVIFTNQGGVKNGKISEVAVKERIEGFIQDVGLPVDAFVSVENDHYRKPNWGMWELLVKENGDVDVEHSFYCGDAAGRNKGWNGKSSKRDFSCSDRKFAFNLELPFKTPEEFFFKQPETHDWEWKTVSMEKLKKLSTQEYEVKEFVGKEQEMVILIGWPGSGKSTFAKKYLVSNGYAWINLDTLKSQSNCLRQTKENLAKGNSVVIDNTNPQKSSRLKYISLAKSMNVPIRAFVLNTDRQVAEHLNMFRECMTHGEIKHIPAVAYHTFNKRLEKPTMDEGFQEIKEVEFRLNLDESTKDKFFKHFHKV